MCGIIGGTHPDPESIEPLAQSMLEQIRHRGPDGGYLHLDEGFFLGLRRLAIINVEAGRQPVVSGDGSVVAVFNGEIYNHRELKAELTELGYQVREGSDAEVIPHAYQEWGMDFPSHLNGDFAIAIFDKNKRQWVFARDRLGIKPFYYTRIGSGLLFGSEVKALFAHPEVQRQLDTRFLTQLFSYWTGLDGSSPFVGVDQVESGTTLALTPSGEVVGRHKYWDIPYRNTVPTFTGDFQESQQAFREELTRSVDLRLQADVEVGTYTSGGVDSSVINVAAFQDCAHQQTQTFSVAFGDADYDESQYQNLMADHLGLEANEKRVQYDDIYRTISDVIYHTESPIFRTAPVPMYLLSDKVRSKGVKVVLTGEGADEVAWGYDIFREAKIRRFWSRQPDSQWRPQLFRSLYAYLPQFQNKRHFNLMIDFFRQDMEKTDSPLYSHLVRLANGRPMRSFLSKDLDPTDPEQELIDSLPADFADRTLLEKCQYLEIRTLLHGYLLNSQGDRMLSANSIEGRFPFLDHHVIEFLAGVPENHRLRSMHDKAILREAYRKDLPEEIFTRPKFAFRAPELAAFAEDSAGLLADRLSPEAIEAAGIFDAEAVRRFKYKFERTPPGKFAARDNLVFVQVLTTQILHERLVDGFVPVPADTSDVVVTRV